MYLKGWLNRIEKAEEPRAGNQKSQFYISSLPCAIWVSFSFLNFHFILCTRTLSLVVLTLTVLNFQPCEKQSQLESLCEGSLKCYHGNFHAYSKLRD